MLHAIIVGSGLITINKSLEAGSWPSLAAFPLVPDCRYPVLPSFMGGHIRTYRLHSNTCWNVFANNIHL